MMHSCKKGTLNHEMFKYHGKMWKKLPGARLHLTKKYSVTFQKLLIFAFHASLFTTPSAQVEKQVEKGVFLHQKEKKGRLFANKKLICHRLAA
jgi:hypothetical protein